MILGTLLVLVLANVFMLLPGIALIAASRGRQRSYPSCGACGYNLTGWNGHSMNCPECGSVLTEVGITPPREKRQPLLLALGLILLAVAMVCNLGFAALVAYVFIA